VKYIFLISESTSTGGRGRREKDAEGLRDVLRII